MSRDDIHRLCFYCIIDNEDRFLWVWHISGFLNRGPQRNRAKRHLLR